MNHRNDDDNYARERDWNRDRDRDREGREGEAGRHEGSRSSFYPGGYGFDEQSSPYGQREPYSASGEGQGGYSQRRSGQGEYDPRRNWGGRGTEYRSSQGWDDRDRGSPYGDRSRGSEWQYGNRGSQGYGGGRGSDDDYRHTRRYGVGYSGSSEFDRDRYFGSDRFTRADEPRYFGTGYYAEGGSAFGGGFGEERWRSHPSDTGWLREADRGRRFFGGHDEPRRGERPGLFRRLFSKGPKGYQRSDERLREDISERLMESSEIDSSEVTVLVLSGKVTLEGSVPERYMKHAIEDLVDACPGVQDIDNRIRVDRTASSYGYSGVSSASSTTPGSTSSTGTSYGSTGTTGMSSSSGYGAGSSTGTTSGSATQSGASRSTRKDS